MRTARCLPPTLQTAIRQCTSPSTSPLGQTSISASVGPRFGVRNHVALNALWLGIQFQDAAILAIVVPSILLKLAPANHTTVLAVIATATATAWVFVPPLAGAISDRARKRGGDRRREVAIALALDIVAVTALALSHTIGAIGVEVVSAGIAIASASSIYQAMLPEVVPRTSWGAAAGTRGAMTLIGTVGGLSVAALLPAEQALFAMALAIALVTPTLLTIPRESRTETRTHRAIVRDWHDLNVTLVARGWMVLGLSLLNTYILYFFSDVLGVHDASRGTGMVAGAALIGAVVSSVAAGTLSDRIDRRRVVALSGIPMVAAALGFAIAPDERLIFLYAGLFGLGYGGVFSVGWALALDSIPALGDVARDLGVWGTLSNLPGILAPAIGGYVIAHGDTPRDGYRVLFALAAASFAIGSLIVLRVGKRPIASAWSVGLVAFIIAFRQPWITTKVRVRQWGRLAFDRGPTVLIANHQHEDESEIMVERAFAQGPWRAVIITASSRRMYEPGFFSTRLPWLGPLMRTVNAGPFFYSLGMYPLENELASRPLRSIASALQPLHGDTPLETVIRADALPDLPASARRIHDLLHPRFFAETETRIKLAHVHDPYRAELVAQLRIEVAEDIARIVDVVKRGATFFVTPEGFYSADGRMRALKGIVDHLTPIADVQLAAVSFDMFRGRRLSMLYRVGPPADPHDLATSLAAARPVTTSALLATWIRAIALPFDTREACEGVVRAIDALPPAAFIDPELERDPERCVDEALMTLERRGNIVRFGPSFDGRYVISDPTGDPRFPHVADAIAYQATFHSETVAALRRLAGAAA